MADRGPFDADARLSPHIRLRMNGWARRFEELVRVYEVRWRE